MKGIIRIKKKRSHYATLDKRFLEDVRLSWGAKGLLAYLLSKPDDWRVMITHLQRQATDGRDAVRARLKELEATGYLRRFRIIDTRSGRVIRWDTVVFEVPGLADGADVDQPGLFERAEAAFSLNTPETPLPHLAEPEVAKPVVVNPTVLSTDNSNSGREPKKQTDQASGMFLLLGEEFDPADALQLGHSFTTEQIRAAIAYTDKRARITDRKAYIATALRRGWVSGQGGRERSPAKPDRNALHAAAARIQQSKCGL